MDQILELSSNWQTTGTLINECSKVCEQAVGNRADITAGLGLRRNGSYQRELPLQSLGESRAVAIRSGSRRSLRHQQT